MDLKSVFKFKRKGLDEDENLKDKPDEFHKEGITYQQLGITLCAKSIGSLIALSPCLHKVYGSLIAEQKASEAFQNAQRKQTEARIQVNDNNVENLNDKINATEKSIKAKNEEIDELRKEERGTRNSECPI